MGSNSDMQQLETWEQSYATAEMECLPTGEHNSWPPATLWADLEFTNSV